MLISLVKADFYKETKKKSFVYSIMLIIFVSVLCLCILNKNVSGTTSDYTLVSLFSKSEYKDVYKYGSYKQYLDSYKVYKECISLENKRIKLLDNSKLVSLLDYMLVFMFLLGVFSIFIGFNSFSYDYTRGSIKYVFMCGKERGYILVSKLLTLFLIMLFYILIYDIVVLISGHLLTGKNIFGLHYPLFIHGKFYNVSYLLVFLVKSLVYLVPFMFLGMFSMFLCILFKGGVFTLVSIIIIYITSLTISESLIKYGVSFIKYTFVPYLDYSYLFDRCSLAFNNMIYNTSFSYLFNSIVLIFYFFILLGLSLQLIKRD